MKETHSFKYELPKLGVLLRESDLIMLAKVNGYELSRIGEKVVGGMIVTLGQPRMPISMTFLLMEFEPNLIFKRVY